jgi:hypothetical protein
MSFMINEESVQALQNSRFMEQFCQPLYETYAFSRIPATLQSLLGVESATLRLPFNATGHQKGPYQAVFFFLIDGFGWRFFQQYASRYPFLQRFIDKGIVSKISSIFPSTTAAHVTCLCSHLTPSESGIYEWFYYEPKVDAIITPLLFSFANDKKMNTLQQVGLSPQEIFPKHTIYHELENRGVHCYTFQPQYLCESLYTQTLFSGSREKPYTSFPDALKTALAIFENDPTPSYFYFYFNAIDAMGHRYGVNSPEFQRAIHECFTACEEIFFKNFPPSSNACCIVSADHGMQTVHPEETIYLNRIMPQIVDYLKKDREGRPIVPAGSCRDFFLHVREECLMELKEILSKILIGKAHVLVTDDLIRKGFFGQKIPSHRFLERVGNLVIIALGEESVWWYEKRSFEQNFLGAHGGLTPEEMETIFLFADFSNFL